MILKYEICFDNHRMESGTQEEKWFHYSYLPELIPCDITFGNVLANGKKKLNRRVITLVYLISRLFYIWFLAINLELVFLSYHSQPFHCKTETKI